MKLAEFFRLNPDIKHEDFAKRIDASQPAVSRYANDERMPDKRRLRNIYLETGGLVTPNDFVGLPELPESEAAVVTSEPAPISESSVA